MAMLASRLKDTLTMQQLPLFPDLVEARRANSGQRRLIFATARTIGLRDEQLHDLAERASEGRTRAISTLTAAEAHRLIGLLKTLKRSAAGVSRGRQSGAA
jgi:hypothetical protein